MAQTRRVELPRAGIDGHFAEVDVGAHGGEPYIAEPGEISVGAMPKEIAGNTPTIAP